MSFLKGLVQYFKISYFQHPWGPYITTQLPVLMVTSSRPINVSRAMWQLDRWPDLHLLILKCQPFNLGYYKVTSMSFTSAVSQLASQTQGNLDILNVIGLIQQPRLVKPSLTILHVALCGPFGLSFLGAYRNQICAPAPRTRLGPTTNSSSASSHRHSRSSKKV